MSPARQMRPSVTLAKVAALGIVFGLCAASAQAAAPIYADSFVASQYVTSFGSGTVTGAPDNGGKYLGDSQDPPQHQGTLIVKFSAGLIDGVGDDLFVVDVANDMRERANIFVSANNIDYTFVGQINAIDNQLDIAGAFAGTFYYVKLVNASTSVSIDVDTVGGYHAAPVPEPGTIGLLGAGLAVLGLAQRRRTTRGA